MVGINHLAPRGAASTPASAALPRLRSSSRPALIVPNSVALGVAALTVAIALRYR